MLATIIVLLHDDSSRTFPLAPYFVAAWAFNACATISAQPYTLNSIDVAAVWRSSRTLLVVALLVCALAVLGEPARHGWLLVGLFAAKLLADGVLLHLLTPYAAGPLVMPQGDTTPFQLNTNPPMLVTDMNGFTHNIAISFYPSPPDTREGNPHPIDLRSPADRVAGGRRLEFKSPSSDKAHVKHTRES